MANPSLTPLLPRRDSEMQIAWQLTAPRGDESCRWTCIDDRWVAVTVGRGEALGTVTVTNSDGRSQTVASYEGALAMARLWRD